MKTFPPRESDPPYDTIGAVASPWRYSGSAAGELPLDHVAEQLDHAGVAAHADMTAVVGVHPAPQPTFSCELVEVRPRHRDVDAGIDGGVAGDRGSGQLHAPDRHVPAAGAELELQHQLELLERRHLVLEALNRPADEGPGIAGSHLQTLCRSSSFLPITMRWISDVPSPISSSGASR